MNITKKEGGTESESEFEYISVPDGYYVNKSDFTISDQVVFFNTHKMELVEYQGCMVYVENAEYPAKSWPSPEGIHAVNMVKSILKLYLSIPIVFLFPKKVANNFNWFFERCFYSYMVNKKYMCMASHNFYHLMKNILAPYLGVDLADKTSYHLAHILEYDDAYRFRLQDLATECNVLQLVDNPRKEMTRLYNIWTERERPGVMLNLNKYIKLLMLILYLPGVKKNIIKHAIYFKEMRYDDSDWYWVAFKDDYKFGGKTHKERLAEGIKIPAMYSRQ